MWLYKVILWCTVVAALAQEYDSEEEATTEAHKLAAGEKKLSENILMVLDHFKQPDPVGLPGADIPDPYPVPDTKQSLSFGNTLTLKNSKLYGISKFRILYVNAEISSMTVSASLTIDTLNARGDYLLSSWISTGKGPYTINVTGLVVTATGNLGVERDGKVQAQDILIDLGFQTIAANFENPGLFGGIIQGLINNGGTFLFDSIKPYVLKEAYVKARKAINEQLDGFAGDMQFPNSVSPLDMVLVDLRKMVRNMQLDPYHINDYKSGVSIFTIDLTNTWVTGISSFHRIGNITLKMEKNTMIADVDIGTQKLEGRTQWEITAVNGLLSRAGTASFSVEYIGARIILGQPLDTRKPPEFRDLDLDIGNIQVRSDGAGTVDYVIEFAVNILPNLLRYQIMDAIELPLITVVQQNLDKINVDELLKQRILPQVDAMQSKGLKLSSLKAPPVPSAKDEDVDEFFDF